MKIEVVTKDFGKLTNWLRGTKQVVGPIIAHKAGTEKVWHGDIMRKDGDLGEIVNKYSVTLWDQLAVENNVQYVLV